MKIFLITGCLLISVLLGGENFAQNPGTRLAIDFDTLSFIRKYSRTDKYIMSLDENIRIEGSMYLDDDFKLGELILIDDSHKDGAFYRYNVYSNEMEIIEEKDTLAIISPERIKYLKFYDGTFIFTKFKNKKEINRGYFELLSNGNFRLLLRRIAIFEPYNPPYTALHSGSEYDRFIIFKSYYLQKNGSPAIKIRKNKHYILSILKDRRKELEKYIKQNKLKLRKDTDLINLISYYNSLIY